MCIGCQSPRGRGHGGVWPGTRHGDDRGGSGSNESGSNKFVADTGRTPEEVRGTQMLVRTYFGKGLIWSEQNFSSGLMDRLNTMRPIIWGGLMTVRTYSSVLLVQVVALERK
jgi:hypothetical protein